MVVSQAQSAVAVGSGKTLFLSKIIGYNDFGCGLPSATAKWKGGDLVSIG